MIEHISHRVFLVGCQRSGTTLLQSMIAAHGKLFSLPETHAFSIGLGRKESRAFAIFKRLHLIKKLISKCRILRRKWSFSKFFLILLSRRSYIREIISILDETTVASRCEGWVEKTPSHVFFVDDIHEVIRDAKFIHIIRDGGPVLASVVDMWSNMRYERPKWPVPFLQALVDFVHIILLYRKTNKGNKVSLSSMIKYGRFMRAIELWNESLVETKKYMENPNHFVCSYEELTTNPTDILIPLCDFLGINFEPRMMEFQASAKQLILPYESWKSENINKLRPYSTEKYDALPSEVKEIINRLLLSGGNAREFLSQSH